MSRVAYSCKSLAYPIVSSAFYLLVSYILKANRSLFSSLYKNNRTYQRTIKRVGAIYNLVMTCFSLIIFYCLSQALIQEYGTMFNHNVWFSNRVIEDAHIRNICWIFTHSKTLEYFDTFFVLLKGGRPIFLQKFHHFGAVWTWFLSSYIDASSCIIATLFNSLVHSFMYCYYFLSVFDESKRLSRIKPIMTSIQQVQLAYCFLTILFDYTVKHYQGTVFDKYIVINVIGLIYGLGLNLLFMQFSLTNYFWSKPSTSKDS